MQFPVNFRQQGKYGKMPQPYERIEGGKDYPFSKSVFPELFYEYSGHTIFSI